MKALIKPKPFVSGSGRTWIVRKAEDTSGRGKPLEYRADGMAVWAYNNRGMAVCASPKPGKIGEICLSEYVISPSGRCKKHGGRSIPAGPGHPTYVNGHTSRYQHLLRGRLAESFARAMENPDRLLELTEEIGLVKSLLENAVASFDEGYDALTLKALAKAGREVMRVIGKPDKLPAAAERLVSLVNLGINAKALEGEVTRLQTHLAGLTSAEIRRLEFRTKSISPGEAFQILADILSAVKELVPDKSARYGIASAINRGAAKLGIQIPAGSIESGPTRVLPAETEPGEPDENLIEAKFSFQEEGEE